jgi:hypothetical protein
VEDGKNLLAHDRAQGRTVAPSTGYFLRAAGTVRVNKERYAAADARARRRRTGRRTGTKSAEETG